MVFGATEEEHNLRSTPPPRIERWLLLKIQDYNIRVKYEAGKNNPVDYMSRHPLPGNNKSETYTRNLSTF